MSHFNLLPGRGWLGAGSHLRVSPGPAYPWDPARDVEETLVSQNSFSFPTRVSPCSCEARRRWEAWKPRFGNRSGVKTSPRNSRKLPGCQSSAGNPYPSRKASRGDVKGRKSADRVAETLFLSGLTAHAVSWGCGVLPGRCCPHHGVRRSLRSMLPKISPF